MSRAALLISGYFRSFKHNIPQLRKNIISKFDNVDIYLHVTNNELHEDKYWNASSEDDISYIIKELSPIVVLRENNLSLSNNKHKNTLLNSWLKYYKLNYLRKENEKSLGRYDVVIKYRPDLVINDKEDVFSEKIEENTVYIPKETLIDKSKLLNSTDPSICDIFAFGSSDTMDVYFKIFEYLERLIKDYGTVSETLLFYYLQNKLTVKEIDIKYNVLLSKCNVFAICGDSGSGKSTISRLLKEYFNNSFVLECDRYHKWERHDENWKSITHLDPEANLISKMRKDIFDLKVGKTIYQVDYDHNTGKFTDTETIESADNIMVCGLHSLYNDTNIFSSKIFMDPHPNLKRLWKIKRDINQRNQTKEEIILSINRREEDYKKFILPQRDLADIIVNFYPKEHFDIYNTEYDADVSLRLLIDRTFNTWRVENILLKNNISHNVNVDRRFKIFNFEAFSPLNVHDLPIRDNTFYDYVLLFILNIYK